jgi:hypothetical protein
VNEVDEVYVEYICMILSSDQCSHLGVAWTLSGELNLGWPVKGCPRNKQVFFGSTRNKPKLNLSRFIFGLFRETNNNYFWFVLVFGPVSKQPKQTDLFRNKPKKSRKKETEKLSYKLYKILPEEMKYSTVNLKA